MSTDTLDSFKYDHDIWLNGEFTQKLIMYLQDWIELAKDDWSEGVYTTETIEGTALKDARALGNIQAAKTILDDINSGDFIEVLRHARSGGIQAPDQTG